MKSLPPNFLTSWKRAQSIASGENSFLPEQIFLCCFFHVAFLFTSKCNPIAFFSLKEKLRMM